MKYDVKEKLEWTVIFLFEFGHKYGLTMKQAFNYLSRFKGIDFIDRHYDYVHTQSFTSMVDDIAEYWPSTRRRVGMKLYHGNE